MTLLLRLCRLIDAMNSGVGRAVAWLILAAVLVSSGNAMIRYLFNTSSNAWLEVQWYLFSAVFLLAAGYTLLRNEHIRIDIIAGRFSPETQTWIDIFGILFFLLPMALLIFILSWPIFLNAFFSHEISGDAGGLIRWPARLLIPAGFFLLILQGISELLKRIAFLAGAGPNPVEHGSGGHSGPADKAPPLKLPEGSPLPPSTIVSPGERQ